MKTELKPNKIETKTDIISVVIPCRNEQRYIERCLNSIINSDIGKEQIEVLVVDGESKDLTVSLVRKYQEKHPFIRLLTNPKKISASAQNIGIRNAVGDFILMMDAHCLIEKNYLSTCKKHLKFHPEADGVSGLMMTKPKENTFMGDAIVKALCSKFGVGQSSFRTGTMKVIEVNTAFCCLYRREVFNKAGFYNEDLPRGQDFEFNQRVRAANCRLFIIPQTNCVYFARSRYNWNFVRYYLMEGFWAIYPYKIVGRQYLTLSHMIPSVFVLSLLSTFLLGFYQPVFWGIASLILAVYFIISLASSLKISIKERKPRNLILIPIICFTIHFSYGLGSVYAFIKGRNR